MDSQVPVVTIDGPVGTGKGTIAQLIATCLEWHILDSGALYRILAHSASSGGIELDDTAELVALAGRLMVRFEAADSLQPVRVIVDGIDVSDVIRSEDCASTASKLAPLAEVRAALLDFQRSFRSPPGLVADGRDMGTVVFPDAQIKIFLTATPEARAERRYKQLIGKGISVNLADLLAKINERDKRDEERATAPLRPAGDAVVIDTTELDIETVFKRVMLKVSERGLGSCGGASR